MTKYDRKGPTINGLFDMLITISGILSIIGIILLIYALINDHAA